MGTKTVRRGEALRTRMPEPVYTLLFWYTDASPSCQLFWYHRFFRKVFFA